MQGDRFVIDDVVGHDLPDGTTLARNRRTGAQIVLPAEVFNAITYCDSFRTMEAQIAHLAGPAAQGREGEIQQILQTVINGGLMLSASAIGAALMPRSGEAVAESAVVAIITCDRPQALARLLDSMGTHCGLDKIEHIVVVDDSRHESSLADNRRVIEEANNTLGSRLTRGVRHFTPNDASDLVEALCVRLPQHESGIRFLLDRQRRTTEVTTGISRNLAQLLAVGRPLLVFDDDVLCTVTNPPESTDGVEFSARQRECRFYASDSAWQGLSSNASECPIERHMQALGSSLPTCLTNLGQDTPSPSSFNYSSADFARRLRPESRVLISQCGSYGDPGSAGNEWIVLLPPENRAQLAEFTQDIGTSGDDRNCWLGRSRPVFEPRANMSQLTGLDNRCYLPPYFPLFRGQDRAFGAMVEFMYPNNLTVDLPFALPHLPIPRRNWKDSNRGVPLPFSLKHFLNDYVIGNVMRCGAQQVGHRNEWLAMLYQDLADSPQSRLLEITADHWAQRRIDWMSKLVQALDVSSASTPPMSGFLNQALRQVQTASIENLQQAELQGPPTVADKNGVLPYWRSAWRDFSAGLRAWPGVRDTAKEVVSS